MKSPLVSIAFPVYNVTDYVIQSIDSVINQTYRNIEIIVIDDCGTDDSMDKIYKYTQNLANNENIRIIHHTKNEGLSAARNTGIKESTGKYIYFVDSDDQISKDCIRNMVDYAEAEELDMVSANIVTIGGNTDYSTIHYKYTISKQDDILRSLLNNSISCSAWNKLIRLETIKENNAYFKEGIIYEDGLWLVQLLLYTKKIGFIPDSTYFYLKRENSITTASKIEKQISSRETIISCLYELIISSNLDGCRLKIFQSYFTKERFKCITRIAYHSKDISNPAERFNNLIHNDYKRCDSGVYSCYLKVPYRIYVFVFYVMRKIRKLCQK